MPLFLSNTYQHIKNIYSKLYTMAEIEEKVIMTADASQLQSTFTELVNEITRTREELKEYKNDKEKSAELTKKLAEQESALVQVMKKNNNEIDTTAVSYRQLNDILKDLNKTYKDAADGATRMDLAPSINALNQELKGMDANIGNFQRNVGNYENAIVGASKNISEGFLRVVKALPSITESPERFFMSLAQALPKLVTAYKSLNKAKEESVAISTEQTAIDAKELAEKQALGTAQNTLSGTKGATSMASQKEAVETLKLKDAEIAETQVTVESSAADLKRIETAKASILANIQETESVLDLTKAEALRTHNYERLHEMYAQIASLKGQLAQVEEQERIATAAHAEAEVRLNNLLTERAALQGQVAAGSTTVATTSTAAGAGAEAMAAGEAAATVATKGLTAALGPLMLILTLVSSVLLIWGKDILDWIKGLEIFNSETKKAAKFQKEWNDQMKEGHQNSAKALVDLQLYSKWATMTSKSDKERDLAAKEVLKTLGSAVTTTNIAKVKSGEYAAEIDNVTKALVKQAQAQAMANKITEKYKEVIEAQDKLADAKSGELGFLGKIDKIINGADVAVQKAVDKAQANLEKVQKGFDQWLDKFLEDFNPSDMLFSGGKENGGGGDNWFSKAEIYIKTYEASLKKLQGTYEEVDLASIWKYSAEGLKYYTQMYNEYIEHNSADEKAYKEALINKKKYLTEFAEYHEKLQKQFVDATKTEYEVDMAKLEEWYEMQKRIYQNAGEDTTALEAEYTKRKEDILDKYVDKYKNAMLEKKAIDASVAGDIVEYNKAMMDLELKNLQDTMDKEIKEYERKGMDTKDLEEHYAQERLKIVSKYASEETKAVLAQIQKREDALKRMNEVQAGYNMIGGYNNETENTYAKFGGTTVTGHQQRQADINATQNEFNIWQDSAQQQIAAMQEILASGKLVGDEKLEMETALADAEKELALGTYEYQVELDQMRLEDVKSTTEEMIGYVQSSLQGLGSTFDDIYTAIEKTMQLKVKEGKLTNEQAEEQLEEYRGIKAAAAMMDALGSAVGAYNSLASIPYVGPALGAIAAGAALAAGIANVKLIMATTKDNAGSGTDSYANASPSLSEYTPQYVTNVTGKDDTDYLANAMSEKPIKAYVVESEVTAAQEVANKTTEETTW